jgi:hypothetical protein
MIVTVTLNTTEFNVFHIDGRSLMALNLAAELINMTPDAMLRMGDAPGFEDQIDSSCVEKLMFCGDEVEVIDINYVTQYWTLAAFRHGNQRAWTLVEDILDLALN